MSLLSKIFGHRAAAMTTRGSGFERTSIAAAQAEAWELRSQLNRYEAANPGSPNRSYVPAFTRDARYDANAWTRWELVRKIRYFERNAWIVGALKKVFQKYTVGPFGVPVIPKSSNPEWNKLMFSSYMQWCMSPCVDSRMNIGAVHKMLSGEFHIDGEIFVLKTRPAKQPGVQSVPKIKLIESHRCSSPGQAYSYSYLGEETPDEIDGVKVNGDGLPVGYYLRDGANGDVWNLKSAADVIHVFDPIRAGMPRGITPYAPILNKTHDLDDLDILEMEKAKLNAEVAYWIQTWNGEIPPALLRQQRGFANGTGPTTGAMDKELEKRMAEYRQAFGARVFSLKPGEEAKQQVSNSPSAATQWYWRNCVSQVCCNLGIPIILILPESIQGTVARGILDDANIYFRSQFDVIAPAIKEIYLYFAQWARYNIKGLVDAPADWDKCHLIPPRAVNVDQGRNSAAMLAELAAGTTNWDDIAGEEGTTAELLIRKKGENVKLIRDIAKELGIEPGDISAPLADVLQKLALATQATAQAEMASNPDPEPKKEAVETT